MRLVDFQVCLLTSSAPLPLVKKINWAFFPIYEAGRLWLRSQKVEAPFLKIVIRVDPHCQHRAVTNCLGICEVAVPVDMPVLLEHYREPWWSVDTTLHGLDAISKQLGWKNDQLLERLKEVATDNPPCRHEFVKFRRKFRGTSCSVWFFADGDLSKVTVRFRLPNGETRERVVSRRAGPLFLEDDFPMKDAVLTDACYVIRDRSKGELSKLPIPT